MQILTGLTGLPTRIAFSPDGRYLGAGETDAFRLWDLSVESSPFWSRTQSDDYLRENFVFAPDGASVVGGLGNSFARHDIHTGAKTPDPFLLELQPMLFAPGGRFALGGVEDRLDGEFQLLCARAAGDKWAEAWNWVLPTRASWYHVRDSLLFSSDGSRLARVLNRDPYEEGETATAAVEVYDSDTGEPLAEWTGDLPVSANPGAVSPTGTVLLLAGQSFFVIHTPTPQPPIKRRNTSRKHFTAATFSRDGSRLATTSNDTAATVWDAATWEVRKRYEWNIGRLRAVCFSPDGLRCAAAGDTGQVVVWDLDD